MRSERTFWLRSLTYQPCVLDLEDKLGADMASFFILVMKKNEDPNYWRVTKRGTLAELKRLRCYDDPPAEVLSKQEYRSIGTTAVQVPRCSEVNIKDDGTIYEVEKTRV